MLSLSATTKIFLAAGATDMRKSFDTLAALVSHQLERDPLSGHLFVFCNRGRNRLKMLHWDGSGYWVFAKRLEQGTFAWPSCEGSSRELSAAELAVIIEGLDLHGATRRHWHRREKTASSSSPA